MVMSLQFTFMSKLNQIRGQFNSEEMCLHGNLMQINESILNAHI